MKRLLLAISVVLGIIVLYWTGFRGNEQEGKKEYLSVNQPDKYIAMERVEFQTKDGVTIVGDYYAADTPRGIVLLHMMPAMRQSWRPLAEKLSRAGFRVLAIDLRGHGESTMYKADYAAQPQVLDYRKFSDAEHQASIRDVEAAVNFLRSKGILELSLGGASIGANLALWYAAEHAEVRAVILLSPGLDYRGIQTERYATHLLPAQSIYIVGDEDDMRSSGLSAAKMAERLYALTRAQKDLKTFTGSGHGTDMLKAHPDFEDALAEWLQTKLP